MIKSIERTKDGMDSMIDRARDVVVGAANQGERGVEAAAERVMEATHAAGDYVRDGLDTASRDARRHLKGAAKAIDRGYARAASDLSRAATATTDFVADNPGKALLLAAAAGFLAGALSRRRQV